MRIEPPPSFACAAATMPAATAAAEPPDEPPVECSGFHGLRAGGKPRGSVVTVVPSSGTLVRPRVMKPAARNRSARYDVTGRLTSCKARRPWAVGSPATWAPRSFSRNGTPRNGPSGTSPAASCLAASKRGRITASSWGFVASMRAIAASTSSLGEASPERTSSACAVASSQVLSVIPGRYSMARQWRYSATSAPLLVPMGWRGSWVPRPRGSRAVARAARRRSSQSRHAPVPSARPAG